jgi:RNA polymerase sigma-70 factor (ECF subfamily)
VILGAADGMPLHREEFARRYESVIRAYLAARWRASPRRSDVDDAVQEVFVECFRDHGALARVEPGRSGGFRAFLRGVVRNVARRVEERHARRRERRAPHDFDVASDDESLGEVFDRAWARALVRQAFALQMERARSQGDPEARRAELLRLRFVEGKTLGEIAADTDRDAGKLRYESARALKEFEAALLEVVRRHHPDGDAPEECRRLLRYFG